MGTVAFPPPGPPAPRGRRADAVVDHLVELIAGGVLQPDQLLPVEPALCEQEHSGFADSPGTARHEGDGPPGGRGCHLRNRLKSGGRFSWKAIVPSADSSVS